MPDQKPEILRTVSEPKADRVRPRSTHWKIKGSKELRLHLESKIYKDSNINITKEVFYWASHGICLLMVNYKRETMRLMNGRVGKKINQLLLGALKSSLKLGLIWLIVNIAMMPRKV